MPKSFPRHKCTIADNCHCIHSKVLPKIAINRPVFIAVESLDIIKIDFSGNKKDRMAKQEKMAKLMLMVSV